MSEQKWDNKGIVARKIICNSIIKDENDRYLTEKEVKSLLQQGDAGSQISDGRGTYTNNSSISKVANSSFMFSDKEEESISLNSMTISGDSLENGMFANSSIVSFVCDTPSLETANHMFEGSDITSCTLYSDKLINAEAMFKNCNKLEEAKMDFSTIQDGDSMFESCTLLNLGYFKLDALKSGVDMFKGTNLKKNQYEIVLNSLSNNNSLETSLDLTIDSSEIKNFFDEKGVLPLSSTEYTDYYKDGKHFRVNTNEDFSSFEEVYPDCDYIEYDDETNQITYYPTTIFENIEDASGLFSGLTLSTPITSFTIPMPRVKKTNGMFYSNKAITTFNSDLRNVIEAEWMFYNASALTSFTSTLYSLKNASYMFRGTKITTFNSSLLSLENGMSMFEKCSKMTSFTGNLSKLIDGENMFNSCSLMDTFAPTSLESLENGSYMFYYCDKLTSFNFNMPKLKNGNHMFYPAATGTLASISSNLDSLENGSGMFCGQPKLTTINIGDLPSLENGYNMFYNTAISTFVPLVPKVKTGKYMFSLNAKLTTISNMTMKNLEDGRYMFYNCILLTTLPTTLNLGKLKSGRDMFKGCKLNAEVVKKIYETLPQRSYMGDYSQREASEFREDGDGAIGIGINSAYSSTASTNLSRLNTFATNAGFANWESMKEAFALKNWNTKWFYAGTETLIEV